MQMNSSPVQVRRPEPLDHGHGRVLSPNEYGRTSFLADPSTPGYSDSEWKAMAAMYGGSGSQQAASLFSASFASPEGRPLTPKTDSFTHSDVVSKHLLVETALLDSSKFDILAIDEVDSLKKEKQKVDARIESARRKLALESKVRDAAQSLHRLYSTASRPRSQRRRSLLGGGREGDSERRGSGSSTHSDTASQAGDELASSTKKIDELLQILVGLENRRQYIESRLLRHTAAVLQAAHSERESELSQSLQDSGFDDESPMPYGEDYGESIYTPRDKSNGVGALKPDKESSNKGSQRGQDNQLSDVNMRLQLLNGQLRSLISQAKRGRSDTIDSNSSDDIPSAYPEDEDAAIRLNNQLEHMQRSILTLVQEHKYMKDSRENAINDATHDLHALEGRVVTVNNQLYNIVSTSADAQNMFDTRPPPDITGHGADEQINYLEETLLTVEQIMQQSEHIQLSHNQLEDHVEDLRIKSESHNEKATAYETTVTGLWDILSFEDEPQKSRNVHDSDDSDDENVDHEAAAAKEPFTLQAFSNKVQQLFERVAHLNSHTETLRRQIQQQRDLAGKAEVNETATRELEAAKAREREALQELEEHRSHVVELQDTIADLEATISEHQDDARLAETELHAKDNEHALRTDELSSSLAHANTAKERAEDLLADRETEMVSLESEVVRLTTELTMARAELDGAYGSRSDRAKDVSNNPEIQAQLNRLDHLNRHNQTIVAELEQLRQEKLAQGNEMQELMSRHQDTQVRSATLENQIQEIASRHQSVEAELVALRETSASNTKDDSRMRALEKELEEMAADYQELTREVVAVEKEREQTEAVVDALRMRIEGLEVQLSDEKARWLGVTRAGTPEPGAREMTSIMVMRTEFKKMMRETRVEAVKALRSEQEERRRLESQIRALRREKNGVGALSPNMAKS